jgi:ethanolamine ammonia-lyase small subunit
MSADDLLVQQIVEEVVRRIRAGASAPAVPAPGSTTARGEACTREPRPVHAIERPAIAAIIPALVAATSSQVAMGRAGNRFRTEDYLRAREGSADARDAVHSVVADSWPAQNDLVPLQSRCRDRHEYLLFPGQGRRLDDPSRAAVQARAGQAAAPVDVQLIVGDGLSPSAIMQNGAATLAALRRALTAAGYSLGTGYFVRYARIAVADEIGVLARARASVILVGERPGLGTGDSLSVYIAVAPKMGQDNAEKNCISNVRPIGIAPEEAAAQTVAILQRGFERGIGGVALGLGWGRS